MKKIRKPTEEGKDPISGKEIDENWFVFIVPGHNPSFAKGNTGWSHICYVSNFLCSILCIQINFFIKCCCRKSLGSWAQECHLGSIRHEFLTKLNSTSTKGQPIQYHTRTIQRWKGTQIQRSKETFDGQWRSGTFILSVFE